MRDFLCMSNEEERKRGGGGRGHGNWWQNKVAIYKKERTIQVPIVEKCKFRGATSGESPRPLYLDSLVFMSKISSNYFSGVMQTEDLHIGQLLWSANQP